MVIKRRIETSEAKALRSQRQHFAAPGGRHDKAVHLLKPSKYPGNSNILY